MDDSAEPIPKVSYNTVKLKRLREMLQEWDLPAIGETSVLENRHRQYVHPLRSLSSFKSLQWLSRWVILYNANLDATQRKSLDQLRRELVTWEKSKQSKKQTVVDTKAHEVCIYALL